MALRFPNPFDHSSSLALIFLKERKMMERAGGCIRVHAFLSQSYPIPTHPNSCT